MSDKAVIFIAADGHEQGRFSSHPSLKEMQEWVGGAIEHMGWPNLMYEGEPCELVVNEEGKLRHLAPNPLGSAIIIAAGYKFQDMIVGPVIIFKGMSLE